MKLKALLPFLVLFATATEPTDPAAGAGGGDGQDNQAPPDAPDGADNQTTAENAAPADDGETATTPRPNAIDGSVLTIDGASFHFRTAPDPENPFHVQIGETAEETDRNLETAIKAAAAYVPPGLNGDPSAPQPGKTGESPTPGDLGSDRIAAAEFDADFPTFLGWFEAVQRWAAFNGRPVPEPTPEWESAYRGKALPETAAETGCLPKADIATANKQSES